MPEHSEGWADVGARCLMWCSNKLFIIGVGSPLALAGWEISLILVSFIRSASIVRCWLVGESLHGSSVCENSEDFRVELFRASHYFYINSRRPALGWPPAVSQEECLSHCIGSPLALGGLEISLILASFVSSTSVWSCRLVGESLPEMRHLVLCCLNRKAYGKFTPTIALSLFQMI